MSKPIVNATVKGVQNDAPFTYKEIILKPNMINGSNILVQEILSEENRKYIIKWDYVFTGTIIVPANCIIEFNGGSISGGTLVGNNTKLIYNQGLVAVLKNTTLVGTFTHLIPSISADHEDLTDDSGVIKFNDKEYNAVDYSGLGRKYLRKNVDTLGHKFDGIKHSQAVDGEYTSRIPSYIYYDDDYNRFICRVTTGTAVGWGYFTSWGPDGGAHNPYVNLVEGEHFYTQNEETVQGYTWNGYDLVADTVEGNILTQEMVSANNTIYHIQYDYKLNDNVTTGTNCVLMMDGGSIDKDGHNFTLGSGTIVVDPAHSAGATGNEPAIKHKGFMYFNITTNNPTWWNGTEWVAYQAPSTQSSNLDTHSNDDLPPDTNDSQTQM